MRHYFLLGSLGAVLLLGGLGWLWAPAWWGFLLVGPLVLRGLYDMLQTRHAILRNFPLLGHGRYFAELIRPEMVQYFIESNTDGRPFSREQRSIVYQRAKGELDTLPFGTQQDAYKVGYEWLVHSIAPRELEERWNFRVDVGGPDCTRPYSASVFNISAMSFGSLSGNAVEALNSGAKQGGFAHNTGEGGVSPYHMRPGGDLIYQIGTGYFGCRSSDGGFSPEKFQESVASDQIRMIELKISQGAKPGHGGILPGGKVTPEISRIRGIPVGQDCLSPPQHKAFSSPTELLEFVARLRELSGGRPVGIKLCVGRRSEFLALCKAMHQTGISPDFVAVDGGEGGTGAAPLEFSNALGYPLTEGLAFVHDALLGFDLRDRVRVIAAGRIITAFDLLRALALGADMCYSARGMLFALGCIQALRCNNNTCPTGITTHDSQLTVGLVVEDKASRVASYHHETLHSLGELLAACGYRSPHEVCRQDVFRRVSTTEVHTYADICPCLEKGVLLNEELAPPPWAALLKQCRAETFARV